MNDLCIRCNGKGTYLGIGMITVDCNLCNEDYTVEYKKEAPSLNKIDRRSKSYQKAIKDIMEINPDIDREEAVRMFDEAYVKG